MPEEIFVVRATPHRIAALGGPEAAAAVVAAHDGWSRLDRDPRAIGAATRAIACVLRWDERLRVTTYAPGGATARDARAATLPGGATLLRQALTYADPRYPPRARLADACRALGVPPALLLPRPLPATPAPAPRTGAVLVGADAATAAADAVLTGQSAWTVPLAARWSLHLWDGSGRAAAPAVAALALAGPHPALGCWWSADEAGFVLVRGGKAVAGHQWGGGAPVTPESTAAAGRLLAADFGVPDQALAVTGLLRRRDLAPAAALASLADLLGLPGSPVGRVEVAELIAWAATVPGAVASPHLTGVAAVRHAVRATPPTTVPGDWSRRRPLWYRLLNGAIAVVMGLATVGLAVVWRGGGISGWWVLAGVLTTIAYAWGLRPRRT